MNTQATATETLFLWRVKVGALRIDPDGTAWATARVANGKLYPHEPRRIGNSSDDGYTMISCYDGTGTVTAKLHRVVYMVHVGPIKEGYTINHKNGLRWDNRVENLEQMSLSENVMHSYQRLGRSRAPVEIKLTEETARDIFIARMNGETITSLSRRFGVSRGAVNGVCSRRNWKSATECLIDLFFNPDAMGKQPPSPF